MRTIVSIFGQAYAERTIGVSGENGATVLEIDVRGVLAQHPSARFSIKFKRPDGELYIAAAGLAAGADAMVRYTVAAADVSVPGLLEMEAQATIDNTVVKTSRYYWAVVDAIDTGWPLPPDPTWVEDVIEAAARSQDGAVRAEDAADRAEAALDGMSDGAERAEAAAERAEESRDTVVALTSGFADAEQQRRQNEDERIALYDVIREEYESGGFDGDLLYATFGVDFDAGDLMMYVPDDYDGPEFAINGDTCSLEVTVHGGDAPIPLGRIVPMPAGDYSAAAAYPFLAVVYFQGDAYLSKQPTQGNAPTNAAYWMRVTHVGEGTTVRIGQVITGAPGTAAAVVNVGTALDQVWNITIPRGLDGTGTGDMTKAVYDTNGNGTVDNAEKLGGALPSAYALKADVPSDALRYDTAQTLTAAQKTAVRTKIGAGTSSFDGQYASLSGAPADVLRYDTAQTLTSTQQANVRAKIGAGAGGFDGDYNSLTNKPTIPSTAADVGAVPTSRTVNGKPLSANVALSASDVSAVPTTRTVNGKALNANITLEKADVGLGSVDNTSDASKPVSTATQTALNGKANTSHTHTQYLDKSGGTMTGPLIAQDPPIGTRAVRNAYAGTEAMEAGVTALASGTFYFQYE